VFVCALCGHQTRWSATLDNNVWISYLTGWKTFEEGFGKLTAGYGMCKDIFGLQRKEDI
jgi:hypothetical protein